MPAPVDGPLAAYQTLLRDGTWQPDATQERVAERLQNLATELSEGRPERADGNGWAQRLGLAPAPPPPRGLFLYGDVGRGKSALADLFFANLPLAQKRRVHFHAFMIEVHKRIHAWRQARQDTTPGDPIVPLARDLSAIRLLCFDEFQVHDVADAMILGRLFEALFELGVVIIATSNRPPDELYTGGINRELFLPFIALIKQRLDVVVFDGPADYRLARLNHQPVYFTPLGAETDAQVEAAFDHLADGAASSRQQIPVQGRLLEVPAATGGIARFGFAGLCQEAVGAADYIEVARQFHTVFVEHIPRLEAAERNAARRLVNLVDVLYEHNVNLICSAEVEPDQLYLKGDGTFEFARTASRLMEMRSHEYLSAPHRG
ncbi:MAG TPA: cell division protein ZapE [Alphaproteobacteria bacterium]|jgi:cell division protein ZapE|nr:cell division protein ZapE [Alphaproteobacteria bacterium]